MDELPVHLIWYNVVTISGVSLVSGIAAQVTEGDAVTWVGVLSGGLPVAAVLLVGMYLVVRYFTGRLDASEARNLALLSRIDELQEERLKERDALLRDVLPVLKGSGDALVRATVLWDRQVNQTGGGR